MSEGQERRGEEARAGRRGARWCRPLLVRTGFSLSTVSSHSAVCARMRSCPGPGSQALARDAMMGRPPLALPLPVSSAPASPSACFPCRD